MKEFVMRRQNNSNENTPVPTKRKSSTATNSPALNRPHSAFIPRPNARSTSSDSRPDQRRRSDFVSRYESLLGRAQAAAKAVDELDLLRLQRSSTANTAQNMNNPTTASEEAPEAQDDEDEEETSVDFNEEGEK